jgi:ATP-dependent Clp protease protease subunit
MMPTAYVYFGKLINSDTITAAVMGCRTLICDKNDQGDPAWDNLKFAIASTGGDVASAFALYNELNSLPLQIDTHNTGAVDSAAIMPFMAGTRRTASANSAFLFHQLSWTFAGPSTLTVVNDARRWLETYEGLMADVVSSKTKLKKDEVLRMMHVGTTLSPADAKKVGLIDAIEEYKIPFFARTYQV